METFRAIRNCLAGSCAGPVVVPAVAGAAKRTRAVANGRTGPVNAVGPEFGGRTLVSIVAVSATRTLGVGVLRAGRLVTWLCVGASCTDEESRRDANQRAREE